MRSDPDHLLRSWSRRRGEFVPEPHGYSYPESHGARHELVADVGSRDVKVWFIVLVGCAGFVRVGSQNWRVENEPSGFMRVDVARRFYRECLAAGMVKP